MSQLEDSPAERKKSFSLGLLFYSGLTGLDEVHPHWLLLLLALGFWLNMSSQ